MKKNILTTILISPVVIAPVALVISCSTPPAGDKIQSYSPEYKDLKAFLDSNQTTTFSSKTGGAASPKNNLSFNANSWKNVDEFKSKISEYVNVSEAFIAKISENKNKIFNQIKRLIIGVEEGTKNINVIIFLNEEKTDKNILSVKVANALTSNFTYETSKVIGITQKETPQTISEKDFNEKWKLWEKDKKNETNFKALLDLGFENIPTGLNLTEMFKITKNQTKIKLELEDAKYNEGYILNVKGKKTSSIESKPLVNFDGSK